MRILVVGGGGSIGQAVVRAATTQGHQVFWTSRQANDDRAPSRLQLARTDGVAIATTVARLRIDTVVDMVAYTLADTEPLLAALDLGHTRYVLISSGDVYRNYGLLHRLEHGAPDTSPLDEMAPVRASRFPYRRNPPRPADDPQAWMDDYDRLPLELATQGLACPWTILRLPMVYGPGDRQRRFRWVIETMRAGSPVLKVPRAWLEWITTYGFIENVAAAIVHAADDPRGMGQTFNIGDEEAVPHLRWVERFRDVMGWRGEVDFETDDTAFSRAIAGLNLSVSFDISARRLTRDLDFRPPVDLATALRATVADEVARSAG